MTRIVLGLCIILGLVFVGTISFKIASTATEEIQKTSEQKTISPTSPEGNTPSPVGRNFVFLIVTLSLVGVIIWAYLEKKGCGWKEIILQPVFIAILGLVVLNAFAHLFIYPSWRWFWNQQTLFWGVNMALIILVHFATKKGLARLVAVVIGGLIIAGFFSSANFSHLNEYGLQSAQAETTAPIPVINHLVVIAPVGKWSEKKFLSPMKKYDFYGDKKHTILWDGKIEENFPREKGDVSKTPENVAFFQARSREDVPVEVVAISRE